MGGRLRFQFPRNPLNAGLSFLGVFIDGCVYVIGPILICLAVGIAGGLSHTFFKVLLPMLQQYYKDDALSTIKLSCHVGYVIFVLVNVLYNYYMCVMTPNKGPTYDRVVRELAVATEFPYPETPSQVSQCKRNFEEMMIFRSQRRQARAAQASAAAVAAKAAQQSQNRTNSSNGDTTTVVRSDAVNNTNNGITHRHAGNSTSGSGGADSSSNTVLPLHTASANTATNSAAKKNTTKANAPKQKQSPPLRGWMLMGPQEWGFCSYSNQPKAPRSHYDHVTKVLVLNMDHYCPWMFNCVGYLNYRYFLNFLLYVFVGLLYGAFLTYLPFRNMAGSNYVSQAKWIRNHGKTDWEKQGLTHMFNMTPLPSERTAVAFAFMLSLSVGIAVACLLGFHLYLVLTAQTTIEFHGNCAKRKHAKKRKTAWINPYDLGYRSNWEQVYGSGNILLSLLPSSREPEFLPVPIAGDIGRRPSQRPRNTKSKIQGVQQNRTTDAAQIV
eukprot:CAMPEP_0195295066 /NCGR_PEP_ID=MMETSP0707-20130614/16537_1 /TAXON_ID=33640 /ORGANISM="Asterionellopsis glacialis, Strain CCMP134" /LENGTH=494 /DNA_ID=CAMNT_0040356201 /DNA_START=183 /DNA_END=1667 /DNA_ORIENTATION=-